jgi:hypothetical protein
LLFALILSWFVQLTDPTPDRFAAVVGKVAEVVVVAAKALPLKSTVGTSDSAKTRATTLSSTLDNIFLSPLIL